MFSKLIKYFWVFARFSFVNVRVFELFMNRFSKVILILLSLLLFFLYVLFMLFLLLFSYFLHMAINQFFSVSSVNTCR